MTQRVLVVDDYEPWRRYIRSALAKSPRWRVVGEVADGVDAVQQGVALRPDLILLDISLPTVSGIEAARQILALQPRSKILFVTGQRSLDVVEAAFATGARGYLIKSDAGRELPLAMEAVAKDEWFISASLRGRASEADHERMPSDVRQHEVGFYSDERMRVEHYARFARAALEAGRALIVVGGASLQQSLRDRLRVSGVDVDRAFEEARYLPLDVADTLSKFMVDDWPDEGRFWNAAVRLVLQAAKAAKGTSLRVTVCGEGTSMLWREGRGDAAIQLEHYWDEVARIFNVEIFCGYSLATGCVWGADDTIQRICAEHSRVLA